MVLELVLEPKLNMQSGFEFNHLVGITFGICMCVVNLHGNYKHIIVILIDQTSTVRADIAFGRQSLQSLFVLSL